jgi:hypothetical protein
VDTAHNTVQLPLEAIERALAVHALPGFFGYVKIGVRLLPTAAHEVLLDVEHHTITRTNAVKEEVHVVASNDRFNSVRQTIQEKGTSFKVSCSVREIVGEFHDGFLKSLKVMSSEERWA